MDNFIESSVRRWYGDTWELFFTAKSVSCYVGSVSPKSPIWHKSYSHGYYDLNRVDLRFLPLETDSVVGMTGWMIRYLDPYQDQVPRLSIWLEYLRRPGARPEKRQERVLGKLWGKRQGRVQDIRQGRPQRSQGLCEMGKKGFDQMNSTKWNVKNCTDTWWGV